MAHDVFISHAAQDKPVADAACAALEGVAMRGALSDTKSSRSDLFDSMQSAVSSCLC